MDIYRDRKREMEEGWKREIERMRSGYRQTETEREMEEGWKR